MEKYITNERTGLKYELVGDYYCIAGDNEPEERPIGIWGQRHLRYLKQHRRTVYTELLTGGKLNDYLVDLNEQAEDMFSTALSSLQRFCRLSRSALRRISSSLGMGGRFLTGGFCSTSR